MSRPHALILFGILLAAGLYCAAGSAADQPQARSVSDSELYTRVADRLRQGESYYPAMRAEIDALNYPFAGSVFNWRLPTLSWLDAALPRQAIPVLLTVIGMVTVGLWAGYFRRFGWGRAIGAALLIVAMLPLWMHEGTSRLHDLWAGQLIAASLGSRALGLRWPSIAFAALALAIRELALVHVLVMLACAVYEREKRDVMAWAGVVALFFAGLAFHASAASQVVAPGAVTPNWFALGGWCFVLRAARGYVLLFATPTWFNAVAVAAAAAGLARWTDDVGRRAGLTVAGYLAAFVVAGLPVNWYWGFLIAPTLPLGLLAWFARQPTRTSS